MRRLLAALAVCVALLSTAVTGHVGWAWLGPPSDEVRVATQVAFLDETLRDGAGPRMQALFPEGDLFTEVLTGTAAARLAAAGIDRDRHLAFARRALAAVDAPRNRGLFAGVTSPPEGVFYRGWRLLLLVEIARASTQSAERDAVLAEQTMLRTAAQASSTGLLESYPGQTWPCDNVVGMAALVRAGAVTGHDDTALARSWLATLEPLRDKATGLLPHQVRPDGTISHGPRGSSQSIIQTFLPDVDAARAGGEWAAYTRAFVVREAGLVGVREYPIGTTGSGDVDSGPLVLGVSASSSAVTLAAARRNGDIALADTLDREAELLGVGISWAGTRRYAAGQLPVGDAFLAWARSAPVGAPIAHTSPGAWWPLFGLLAVWPAIAVGAGWHRLRHGRR
ncbi:MAG TPA: hypothetical protein P5181_13980 [Dermatophilaceae bacterium]|nr:hypothetical protein [Dermatophilaceae bacterium]